MTLLLIFVSAAFAVTALYFTFAPFLASREEQARAELIDEELKQVEQLVASKSMLLQSLRELEFEFETAKMSKEDYERFRTSLERQAVGVMRELDRIHGGRGWEEKINEEVSKRLVQRGLEPITPSDADEDQEAGEISLVEAEADGNEIADEEPIDMAETDGVEAEDAHVSDDANDSPLDCDSCGAEIADDDLFCSKCGTPTNFDESKNEAVG